MKVIKYFILQLAVCLILIADSYGQSSIKVSGGATLNIAENTSMFSWNTFIDEEGQLTNRGELTVVGMLGNFAGPPGLVIKSDENGYGTLLHYSGGVQATVEQYLSSERWHLVTPPITNSEISTYMSIYLKEWKEPISTWEYLVSPVTLPMNITQGYACWASDALTGDVTVQFEGDLVSSNMALLNLSYSPESEMAGWNLVGNPYPCALEWNTDCVKNNVGGWATVYDNGIYCGWNPWMPEGERSYNGKTDGYIAPGQGFWVKAFDENPLVLVPQSARAHKPDIFLKDDPVSTVCNIHLFANGNNFTDETTILFMEEGTIGFDGLYELEKHMNVTERPNIYSNPPNGLSMSVQLLPEDWIEKNMNATIPIGFKLGVPGDCSIQATGLDSFEPGIEIYLEDKELGFMHNLLSGDYQFYNGEDNHSERFLLHFNFMTEADEYSADLISIYSNKNCVYVKMPEGKSGNATVFDIMGREVSSFGVEESITRKILYGTGYYVVHVMSGNSLKTEKVYISN